MKNNQNSNIHLLRSAKHAEPVMLDIKQLVKTYDNGHQAVKGVDCRFIKGIYRFSRPIGLRKILYSALYRGPREHYFRRNSSGGTPCR